MRCRRCPNGKFCTRRSERCPVCDSVAGEFPEAIRWAGRVLRPPANDWREDYVRKLQKVMEASEEAEHARLPQS